MTGSNHSRPAKIDPLTDAMAQIAIAVEKTMTRLLPEPSGHEAPLHEAMRYAALQGGKRLRPFLVVASADLFGVSKATALRVGAAFEAVHCYSLVHDDLPCMDDDSVRRGKPTVHIAFDQATAVLAGDALLTLAFDILSHEDTHPDPHVRCDLVRLLAQASGHHGMVGGQMIDLLADGGDFDLNAVSRLQQMKTGALIVAAIEAGAVLGRAGPPQRHALKAYGHDIGLAFQIADDLLDVEGDPDQVGKKTGKDAAAGKATLVSIVGPERARTQAEMLAAQAKQHLEIFDSKADVLRAVADFVITRRK